MGDTITSFGLEKFLRGCPLLSPAWRHVIRDEDHSSHETAQLARDGAEKLDRSLGGYEWDMPHKNLADVKEFNPLWVELRCSGV
jgi:hypothetical protein